MVASSVTKVTKAKKPVNKDKNKLFISDVDCYLFGQGTHYDIYKNSARILLRKRA